jgi:hypothetical protein
VLELHGGPARSPVLGRGRDTNGCYANDDQLQVVTHIMTHRSECFAGKTESSVAFNAEADTTPGGWAIRRRLGNGCLSASRTGLRVAVRRIEDRIISDLWNPTGANRTRLG